MNSQTIQPPAPARSRRRREDICCRAHRWLGQCVALGQSAAQIAAHERVSVRTVQLALKWARAHPEDAGQIPERFKKARPPELPTLPASWAKEFRERPEFDTDAVREWLATVSTRRRGKRR